MRQYKFLVLLVVAFAIFVTDSTFATSTTKQTATELNVLNVNRNLKGDSEVTKTEGGTADPDTEERALNLKWLSLDKIKNVFRRPSNAGAPAKDIATALNSPKTRQVFDEVGKQPGIMQKIMNIGPLKALAGRLQGKSVQYTPRQVTNIGHLAVVSSSSGTFTKLWVKWGALFLFVIGVLFLFTVVYKGMQPN